MANPFKEIPSSFGLRNANALLLPAKGFHYFENNNRFPFDPTEQGHSLINAWWLAECSLLAYETKENVNNILEKEIPFYDKNAFIWFENHATGLDGFGLQSKDKDFAILSFRGTEFYRPEDVWQDFSKLLTVGQDIIEDSQLWTRTFDESPKFDVPVIQGFYRPLESVWPQLKLWIESLPKTRNLWLTGHSLGAAIAVLLAYQFPDRVAGVYTFGCPCPGKQDFANAFDQLDLNKRTFRYVHGNDLVAKGLEFPDRGYRHVGTPIILQAAARRNLLELGLNLIFHRDITDHAPQYYALHCWNRIP
jgi:predicted lipase